MQILSCLLFALFVVLYAMSKVDEGKYKVFSHSLNFAFGCPSSKPGTVDPNLLQPQDEQELLLKSLVDKRNATGRAAAQAK
jgi:chemotaxis protein MotB